MKSEAIQKIIEGARECQENGLISPARYNNWDKFIEEFEGKLLQAQQHEEALSQGFGTYHEMARAYEMGFM